MSLHVLLALLAAAPSASDSSIPELTRPRLIVLDLTTAGGVEAEVAQVLTETLTAGASALPSFQVMSSQELRALMGIERQKQMLGCTENECIAELGGAMGARFVMTGSVARLGTAYQLNLTTLDTRTSLPLGRATRIAEDLRSLRAEMPVALADATATPRPVPPSRVLPTVLLTSGVAAVIGGGLLGMQALADEDRVESELAGGTVNALPRTAAEYGNEAGRVRGLKTVSAITLGVGALLAGAGAWLTFRGDLGDSMGTSVAVSAGPGGVSVTGVLP